jgi:hypothetical protein
MEFFIGWHQPVNGRSGCNNFANTMISINRLLKRESYFAVNNWILDSGAFSRISSGKGHLSTKKYAKQIIKWSGCGNLLAAVTQDYMCEKPILDKTKLTIIDHQKLTIHRYDRLLTFNTGVYIMPVLQGFEVKDYLAHLKMYSDRLKYNHWLGVGSVCKRNGKPDKILAILAAIKSDRPDLKLHGFGLKITALKNKSVWDLLHSADSQAHGLRSGSGSNKYLNSNCPITAGKYADEIMAYHSKPQ